MSPSGGGRQLRGRRSRRPRRGRPARQAGRRRQNAIAASGSSQVENGDGRLAVLAPGEPLLLGGGDDLAVDDEGGGGVVEDGVDAEDAGHVDALSEKRFKQNDPGQMANLAEVVIPPGVDRYTTQFIRVLGDRPEPVERAAYQPRHVHLRDTHPLGDLGLRQVLDEAQVKHDAVARGERLQRRRDRRAVLDELEAVVLDADRLGVGLAVALVAEAVGLQGDRVVRRRRLHRLQDLLGREPSARADLGDRRRAAEPARELLDRVVDLHHALLHPARDVHGPAVVAEVALELAEHRRHGVGRRTRSRARDRSGRSP